MRVHALAMAVLAVALADVASPAAASHPCNDESDAGSCGHPPGGSLGAVVTQACGVIEKTHVASCFGP